MNPVISADIHHFKQKLMRTGKHVLFWSITALLLVIGFGSSYSDFSKAFYFVSFLLPVAIGTSYFFNYYLVPKFLLPGYYLRFSIYTIYALIVSLYLEMLVIVISFVIIANYNIEELHPIMANIFVLAVTIYLIVVMKAFVLLFQKYKNQELKKIQLTEEKEALKREFISVRSNRENRQIPLDEIIYFESMGDYVNICTSESLITTKETITHFNETLPEYFIRIHRSFIVNRNYVSTFSHRELKVNGTGLPIGRSYKSHAIGKLSGNQKM